MMAKAKAKKLPRIDVVWNGTVGMWMIKRVGGLVSTAGTQGAAIVEAKKRAGLNGGATVRIHRKDGRIRRTFNAGCVSAYTYPRSRDPRRSKG